MGNDTIPEKAIKKDEKTKAKNAKKEEIAEEKTLKKINKSEKHNHNRDNP